MIKRYATVTGVAEDLGDKAVRGGKCQVCGRADVTVYPLLALLACAACVVVQTGGLDDGT